MENSVKRPANLSKRPRLIFWRISLGLILLGIVYLAYYGYCWGRWGRNNLLWQYLFQCSCPLFTSKFRYPEQVGVVVPSCGHNGVILSPSGRLMYVNDYIFWDNVGYFLNLESGEKVFRTLQDGPNYFLTDNLMFHERASYILDLTNGVRYPVQNVTQLQPSIYVMGVLDPELLLGVLSQIDQIFLIDTTFQPVIVLPSDFRQHPENIFVFDSLDIQGDELNRMEQFLKTNKVDYSYIPGWYSREAISYDGKFVAREDGIYTSETGQKIVDGFSPTEDFRPASGRYFWVVGWMYDDSGAIYANREDVCLIEASIFVSDVCIIKVPQPVLKLKVPQEYLDGTIP